jgi:DNA-binding transcriptional ArsR family regulator
MDQCVAFHRRQDYPPSFREVFRRVTGRNMTVEMHEAVEKHLGEVERVIFVPSCHLGPYFLFTPDYPLLQVAFNCGITSAATPAMVPTTAKLFPPLKALADETRLQIITLLQSRELYAQEIVEALGLSQPTVSRHLQLLERTEVVQVRRKNGMKYYSINRERGREVIAALRPLIAS